MQSSPPGFVFGTKAETIERIAPLLRHSKVLPWYCFRASEWGEDKGSIVEAIRKRFGGQSLIIRSSTFGEDSDRHSMAGAFASCLSIDGSSRHRIEQAIERVIASYSGNPLDQVLVQPMLLHVALSGVVMTHHLEDGAPYYIVNYDDETSRTDSITGGRGVNKTVLVYRQADPTFVTSPRIRAVLQMVKEMEEICGPVPLDIEFGMTQAGEIFLFQVRQISVWKNWNVEVVREIAERLPFIEEFVNERSLPRPGLAGQRTILGSSRSGLSSPTPDRRSAEMPR